jgi:hypothetical protein
MLHYPTTVDRFNKDIVEIALSLEEDETYELYQTMVSRMPSRRVSERYKHGNYHTNAEAIVLGNWSYRKPYIMCGLPGFGGAPSCCHQTIVCEACCKKAAARMYVRYEKSFTKAQHWYAITYSFTSNVFLDTATQSEYLERYALADRFIKSLKAADLIQGAVAIKEVSVNSFHGKAVFPHTHVVANSDRSDLVDMDGVLHPAIAEEASRQGVSIRVSRINDDRTFLYELKYPLKPINIKQLYQEEQFNYDTNEINVGVDIVLGRITEYTKGKPRIVYYGNMDARCNDYMGTEMNAERKAARKLKAMTTKELNSNPASPTMVSEQVNTKEAAVMPLGPQPVMPPQVQAPQKKKNFWGPLALGLGAGVAGLGAADFLLNKGRATNSIVESIKSRFGGQGAPSTPSPAPNAVLPPPRPRVRPTLGIPRTEADVMADAAAGTIGTGATSGARDAWQKWMKLLNTEARENTFAGIPGQQSTDPAIYHKGILDPRLMNSDEGQLAHYLTNVGERVATPSEKAMSFIGPAATAGDVGNDAINLGLGTAKGGLNLASKLPAGVGPAIAASPTAAKLLGGMDKAKLLNSKATRGLSILGGGVQGYQLGHNPLNIEVSMADHPNLTPQQAALLSEGSMAAGGAAVGGYLPFAGNLIMAGENMVLNNAVDKLRTMSGTVAERGALGDLMGRWYRGTQAGSPLHRNALERALKYIDENKELQQSIAGEAPAAKWKLWKYFSPATMGQDGWGGDTGSPALQSLIQKSRQAIMQ